MEFPRREQRLRKATAAALVLFVVLSLVLTYPLAFHLATAVEDRQDALLNVWITAWDGHQLLSDPLHLFDANIFHPYPRTLAYSELLLGNALLALPITAASGNPVLGYNVALLLSFVLSALGTYLLVLRLTRSPGAGVVAGVIFAFSSYRMTNLAQAQLLITQWIPLALLSLHLLLRRPKLRHVATFVLFFWLQALSSFYYAILLAFVVAGYAVWEIGLWLFARRRASPSGNPLPEARHGIPIPYLLLAGTLCILFILPFALPYFRVQGDLGFERTLADSEPFSASLRQYLMVPPGSVVHGNWLPSDATPIAGGYPVDALFPGLLALALAILGMIRGRNRLRWFFFLLILVSLVLSLGPRLYLQPGQSAELGLTLPYAWLYALVPGFKALRAPVRFDALAMLALAVLAGFGVALPRRERRRRRFFEPLALALAGLIALESLVWPAAKAEGVPVGQGVPQVYGWLAEQGSGPVMELPMAFTPAGPQLEYQYYSAFHWRTTPDGYSGFVPPKHGQIVYEMGRFPSDRSVSLLQALGVQHVVVHTEPYAGTAWQSMQEALSNQSDLNFLAALGADRVYEIEGRSFDPSGLEVSSYLSPRAVTGEPYTAYLMVTNTDVRSYAILPTQVLALAATWRGPEGGQETEHAWSGVIDDLPLVTSGSGGIAVLPVSLVAPPAPGAYHLSLLGENGVLGEWTAAGTVEVVGEDSAPGSLAFPVPVRLEDWTVAAAIRPGQSLPIRLTWQALGKIDAYYSVYVKLLDGAGTAVAGWDGQPQNGQAPTLLWVPGETLEDLVALDVPSDAPSGEYLVEVGMYRALDLARCLTFSRDGALLERVVLGTVKVEP
jgi:hypothetical protein